MSCWHRGKEYDKNSKLWQADKWQKPYRCNREEFADNGIQQKACICQEGYFCPEGTREMRDPNYFNDRRYSTNKKTYKVSVDYKDFNSKEHSLSIGLRCLEPQYVSDDPNSEWANNANRFFIEDNRDCNRLNLQTGFLKKDVDYGNQLAQQCPRGYYCPHGTFADPRRRLFSATSDSKSLTDLSNPNLDQEIALDYDGTTGAVLAKSRKELTCKNGYFCPPGSRSDTGETLIKASKTKIPLDDNKGIYETILQNSNNWISHPCPAGYYCPRGTMGDENYVLHKDKYSSDFVNNHTKGNAFICPKGYYCEEGAMARDDDLKKGCINIS